MLMVIGKPPNYGEITKRFKVHPFAVYTYGDRIYNPTASVMSPDHIVHEKVHVEQQRDGAAAWWQRYLVDPAFVLEQELEAYRKQYAFFCLTHHDRNHQLRMLRVLAADLASPMYGSVIGFDEAMREIRGR